MTSPVLALLLSDPTRRPLKKKRATESRTLDELLREEMQ